MRLFLLSAFCLLLAACNPEPNSGPRIDLVGSTTPAFLSANRSSTTPADTFTTRVFAEARDAESPALTHLRITVDYSPHRNPYIYPTGVPFDPERVPKENPATPFVYLDSVLAPGTRALAFQYTAVTRSTSGRETWTFQAEDTEGASNKRSFVLTLRNTDSLLTYHRYTLRLQAPRTRGSRSYLALPAGLALPAFALGATTAQNRDSIDVVYVPLGPEARGLAAPADPTVPLATWSPGSKRATEFRRPAAGFTLSNFTEADTAPELLAAFEAGTAFAPSTRTGALTKGQLVAFRTAGEKPKVGLLYVEDFPTAPQAAILLQVRITK